MKVSKARKKNDLVTKTVNLGLVHIEIVNNFIEKKGMVSESDVVRQALMFMHEKTFPDYVFHVSPEKMKKFEEKEEEKRMKNISDEEYCTTVLKAPIFDSPTDGRVVVLHTIANSIKVLPVKGIKDFLDRRKDMIQLHMNASVPILEKIKEPMPRSILQQDYGIVLE